MTKAAEGPATVTNGERGRDTEADNVSGDSGGGAGDSNGSASGPSSPTPSVACEACSQMSQLELEAFAAVREVAPFVRTISISEILPRTPQLLFLNLLTLENENFCIELTQRGWRICSDRYDCMYGDFKKLDMHVAYYDTIYQLLDCLSKQYRERFGETLARKLSDLQNQQQQQQNGEVMANETGGGGGGGVMNQGQQAQQHNEHGSGHNPAEVANTVRTATIGAMTNAQHPTATTASSSGISTGTADTAEQQQQQGTDSAQQQQQFGLMDQQQQRPSSRGGGGSSTLMQMMMMQQQHTQQQRKLFIGGLGQVNDDALRHYYSQWGQVVDCIVIRDPVTRASRGFGFVTYATIQMADVALAHRPHNINGKAVDAKRAVPRERMNLILDDDPIPFFMNIEPDSGCRLQLSALNWEWHTLDTLRTHFGQFGPVEQLEMVAFPRGCGSLVYGEATAAKQCLAAGEKHSINGHPVEVKLVSDGSLLYAPARPNSSDSVLSSASSSMHHIQQPHLIG